MTHIGSVAVTAQATFGRDGAMFESLLGFVSQLSVVLWSMVVLTAVIRFVGIRIYRRGARRTALVETVAPSAAVPSATVRAATVRAAAVPAAAVPAAAVPAAAAAAVRAAGQLTDAGLLRLGLFGFTAAEQDAVLGPAEHADSEFVDFMMTDAVTDAAFDEVRQQAEAPAAVGPYVKVPRHALHNRRAEPRSAAHVPAFAANSTGA